MLPSTRALLGGIVDYAGTFPPASLGLADALSEYAKARIGTDSWLLGRFVLSAAHLDDFAKLAPMHLPATGDEAGIGFKATAGLHHAVRGCYALTYETASATDTMYGFLNLAVAAALIRAGAVLADVVEALVEPSADAFRFSADALTWRSRTIS